MGPSLPETPVFSVALPSKYSLSFKASVRILLTRPSRWLGRIFTATAQANKSLKGALQIIVLEHADQTAWGDQPNVVPVQDWRRDTDYLIIAAWIN